MIKPIAVEKLKNEDVADKYKLNLHNRFQVLQDFGSFVEEQWKTFRQAVIGVVEECIGRRRSSQKESWIKERPWKIIDKAKSAKYRMQQAKTMSEK